LKKHSSSAVEAQKRSRMNSAARGVNMLKTCLGWRDGLSVYFVEVNHLARVVFEQYCPNVV
jgi:hypothetical protein